MELVPPSLWTSARQHPLRARVNRAFTLVELLVVMGVIAILIGLTGPVIRAIKGAEDINSAVYGISDVLGQARAYALANNTYVYVGLGEFDAAQADSGTQKVGTGRLAVSVIATRDGTRSYSPYTGDVYTDWQQNNYSSGGTSAGVAADFVSIDRAKQYNNVHLIDLDPAKIPGSGPMCRPAVTDAIFRMGTTPDSATATPFSYPVGSNLTGGRYTFNRVIQFDPQGEARSIPKTSPGGNYQPSGVPDRIEIALEPANGNQPVPVPANQTSGNLCVLQVDGMTGSTSIYRP